MFSSVPSTNLLMPTKEEFIKLHFTEGKSLQEIASQFGIKPHTFRWRVHKLGWETRPVVSKYVWPTKEEYEDLYVRQKLSLDEIGARLSIPWRMLQSFVKKNGWYTRPLGQRCKELNLPTKAEYYDLYVDKKWTLEAIAEKYGISYSPLYKHAAANGWELRRAHESRSDFQEYETLLSEEVLRDLYEVKGMSCSEIAGSIGCACGVVTKRVCKLKLKCSHKRHYGFFHKYLVDELNARGLEVFADQINYRAFPYRFRLDIAFPDLWVGIEVDEPFHSDSRQATKELQRDAILERAGWSILRFGIEDLQNRLDEVIALVRKTLGRNKQEDRAPHMRTFEAMIWSGTPGKLGE